MEQAMAEITVHIPNAQFRRKVVEAVAHEPFEMVMHLIIDLVENIAGDPEANEELKHLVQLINSYIEEETE